MHIHKLLEYRGGIMTSCQIPGEDRPNKSQKYRIKELIESLPDDDHYEKYSGKLKALSDATRLKILYLLSDGELCVCEIIYALNKPQSSISHHLNILKNLGFIKSRKEGVWIHYSLKSPEIIDTVKILIKLI
jgi:DNA-binding transcriptional ArsR family regulator